MAYPFTSIEKKWQQYWRENKCFRALEPGEAGDMPKAYILDMFPYPSGEGLHVGHPLGYLATDILARYLRMRGCNVLHPMGWDAFGLPAEQYAIKTGQHPRKTTETNVVRFRGQLDMIGMGYDWDRQVNTTDPAYYKWTQWIFLQLFNSYFDPGDQKAKPISYLINELSNENLVVAPDGSVVINPTQEGLEEIAGEVRVERVWRELSPEEQRDVIDGQRLAYMDEAPVNWCPGLGTVLSNEEVIDGKSDIGGFPVERRPMRQWLLRITKYAERLLADLDMLQWPESLKEMQRNWIGRSVGAEVDFVVVLPDEAVARGGGERAADIDEDHEEELVITVFTTRPDTLFGATYMVLAPEHPLVDRITPAARRETVEAYRTQVAAKSERDRLAETKDKTGVFTGAYAINPANEQKLPVYIADYVLMGYGTGAIMAVPGQDQRDWDFARKFELPIIRTVKPPEGWDESKPYLGDGPAINSEFLNTLKVDDAKERIIEHLEGTGDGVRSIKYKLRDWLFSRQRYWGEPFPILIDEQGNAVAIDESELPLTLPEMADYKPTGTPDPPLSKAPQSWLKVERDGKTYTRETNVMPQWAGSCWYYLRYLDPKNDEHLVDAGKERYWMSVDLYVGGVEHAVLHLLYARFWHKVLFDLGYVSSPEPFARLVNQGIISGEIELHLFENAEGVPVSVTELRDVGEEPTDKKPVMVGYHKTSGERLIGRRIGEDEAEKRGTDFVLKANPAIRVDARSFKMSKSRGNVVNPDDIIRDYGADTFRLYEMYMGPLEDRKPWNTRDIVGMSRFLNAVWRNLVGDEEASDAAERLVEIESIPVPEAIDRQMHRAIKKVGEDLEALRFNTAIAELIKLNNEMGKLTAMPRELAENFVLMLAPFAPHIAEDIWSRFGHTKSLSRRPWPTFDPAKLTEASIELPVQVNGKVRDKITVPSDADEATILKTAEGAERVQPWIAGKSIKKKLYVPKKLVNLVVG